MTEPLLSPLTRHAAETAEAPAHGANGSGTAGARENDHDQPARHHRPKKLGLVIDLDTCVGCHACAVACKEWNAGGVSAPLTDRDPYGAGTARRLVQPRAQL